MKPIFSTLASLLLAATAFAADLPTGDKTPEGIACDALAAFIKTDSKAWLATLVKPIYGQKGNQQYAEFKKSMAAEADKMKNDKTYKPPRIIRCYKARNFSKNGPGSAAYAFFDFHQNMFVDLVIETAPGETEGLRYHVLCDKDGRWYFEPRPDLCPLVSTGLNDEPKSTEVLYEAK